MAGYDWQKAPKPGTAVIGRVLKQIELYKLLRYISLRLKYKPKPIDWHFKWIADHARWTEDVKNEDKREPWIQESLKDYERYHLEMIDLANSRGAEVMLLYNELSRGGPYLRVLQEISKAKGVPLVDSSVLIAEARSKMEEELEAKLNLRPPRAALAPTKVEIEVVFRVYMGKYPVPKSVYIVGDHPKLGNLVPNKVLMYDDGTHGDQRAGDTVWSYSATFAPGTRLFYIYINSGQEGKWEGLDVPEIREFTVEPANGRRQVYRPIESFGKMYMQADPWHTDATGYELIARALLEKLKREERFRRYLPQIATN